MKRSTESRTAIGLAVGLLVTVTVFAQVSELTGAPALVESLLFGFEAAPADPTNVTAADVRLRMAEYEKRERQFKPTIKLPGRLDGDGPEDSLYRKYVGVERTVFCLFDRPDSLRLAEEFASEVVLYYEWEGMADGPLAEAASADAFLARHRNSPIAAYVHLFSGHRKLCAVSEYTGADPTTVESRRITRDADRELRLAHDSGHPLVRVVADYLLKTRKCAER